MCTLRSSDRYPKVNLNTGEAGVTFIDEDSGKKMFQVKKRYQCVQLTRNFFLYRISWFVVAGQRFMVMKIFGVMLPIPTLPAKITKTLEISTEVRTRLNDTQTTRRIFQIRINLNLQKNFSTE